MRTAFRCSLGVPIFLSVLSFAACHHTYPKIARDWHGPVVRIDVSQLIKGYGSNA